MHNNGAYDQEPDHNFQYFVLLGRVSSFVSLVNDRSQEFPRDIEVENGTNANRAKEAHEGGVLPVLHLVDKLVKAKHHWQASKKENQDAQRNQSINWDHRIVNEFVPRAHGACRCQHNAKGSATTRLTKPHENCDVQQHVDCRLQAVVHGFESEPVVPREDIASYEASQHVVGSKHTYSSNDEQL